MRNPCRIFFIALLWLSFFVFSQNSNLKKDLDNCVRPPVEMDACIGLIGINKRGKPIFEKGNDSELVKEIQLVIMPKPILIIQQGKIMALDEDTKGKNLTNYLT